jgi:hypothetical protein
MNKETKTLQTASNSETTGIRKSTYAPPRLVNYGQIRSLTQAQSSGSAEGSAGTPPQKPMSDRTNKENIVRIGTHPLGIGVYLFDYKTEYRSQWGHGRQFGVMAQEVETVLPEAVSLHPDGYKVVNYTILGIDRSIQ